MVPLEHTLASDMVWASQHQVDDQHEVPSTRVTLVASGLSMRAVKRSPARLLCALILAVVLGGIACQSLGSHEASFADQHFKTAVAVIELHRTRFGYYPESLAELKFLGDWDLAALQDVEYRRLEDGYELNLTGPRFSAALVSYPNEFTRGLGLKRTNVHIAEP